MDELTKIPSEFIEPYFIRFLSIQRKESLNIFINSNQNSNEQKERIANRGFG